MKRKPLLFLLVTIFSSQILPAQISKGDIFLGGQVFFGTYKSDYELPGGDYTQTTYNVTPALGFVTKDNLVIGFDIPFYYIADNNDNPNATDRKQFDIGAGVFVRKYFEVAKRLYFFTQGRLGGSYRSEKVYYDFYHNDTRGYNVGVSFYPGVSFLLKRNIHLESGFANLGQITYHSSKTTSSLPGAGDTKTKGFGITAISTGATNFTVGVRFFLRGKSA